MSTADFVPIQTKASLMRKRPQQDDFQVTVFEPKKAKANRPKFVKPKPESGDKTDEEAEEEDIDDIFSEARRRKRKAKKEDPQVFDISRARKEVINYGISGLDRETKLEAKVALAVKLGAKPPKNAYRNYKEILEERRREKTETDRESRRRKGQSYGAARSYQQQKQRAREKASNPNSVTRHYGVVKPKMDDRKKRKAK
ncbi:uncharacterized protein C1orf131 homolog [Aedes aegypti]|uniref:Uncharacterized protein n=1 Tax=Aedes aegypti TaxID=7159 RepID=A0A903TX65_AEDAE|nr:uncharacterized protein C1orf131 homolog [Aedes aegypti]